MSDAWHAILTPSDRAGAIAMIHLRCESNSGIGLPRAGAGQLRRADLFGIDDGVILGIDDRNAVLMPHGGVAIVQRIAVKLRDLGIPPRGAVDPVTLYPEAESEIEAWALHALSHAASPKAVDVVLDHARRWAAQGIGTIEDADGLGRSCGQLDRLIDPPSVVAVGRANVGKSSLLNALVGQRVALVADVTGTTRDHVGAPVDLGGLVVRWIDTPGIDERIADAEEISIATRVIEHADLVVHCIDSMDDPGVLDPRLSGAIAHQAPVVRVGTRSDLGQHGCEPDVRVRLGDQQGGLTELVSMIREALVPERALQDPTPWRFWGSITPGA